VNPRRDHNILNYVCGLFLVLHFFDGLRGKKDRLTLFVTFSLLSKFKTLFSFLTMVSWDHVREDRNQILEQLYTWKPLAIAKECKVKIPIALFSLNVLQFQGGI